MNATICAETCDRLCYSCEGDRAELVWEKGDRFGLRMRSSFKFGWVVDLRSRLCLGY